MWILALLGSALWLAFNAAIVALLIRRYRAARANLASLARLEAEHRSEAELIIGEAFAVHQLRQDPERYGVEGLIEGRKS